MGWSSIQQRLEETAAGRIVVSAFVVVTLVAVLAANLPASRLQDLLLHVGHRYIYATGLDQSWGVFSPDPRRQVIHVVATVTYSDGTTAEWQLHKRNAVLGAYVDYRWRKWQEFVVSPGFETTLGHPFAVFTARRLATPTKRPVKVTLTNNYYDLSQPGFPETRVEQHQIFYTTRITEADLRGTSS